MSKDEIMKMRELDLAAEEAAGEPPDPISRSNLLNNHYFIPTS